MESDLEHLTQSPGLAADILAILINVTYAVNSMKYMQSAFVLGAVVLGVAAGGFLLASSDLATASDSDVKFHFTKTVASEPSEALGHEGHQFVYILSPNNGTIYDGSMTYTANKVIQIAVLHEIGTSDNRGQPTWTVGDDTYGWTLVKPDVSAGSFEFTGAALGLHTGGDEFVATVSLDGWVRGAPADITMEPAE